MPFTERRGVYMEKISLYVVTHKNITSDFPERTLIGVGDNKPFDNIEVYDDVGDNISYKNAKYCELTALYWIWKNDQSDIIGLEHYRRQFVMGKNLLSKKRIKDILNNYDVIVPHRKIFDISLYYQYAQAHEESDLLQVENIIREKYPDYLDDFEYLRKTNRMYTCNMFIARKKFVDKYCAWLFDILFDLEKKIDLSEKDEYQKRIFGFMGERLFNVYLYHNRKKLKVKSVLICEPISEKETMKTEMKYLVKKIINYQGMYR